MPLLDTILLVEDNAADAQLVLDLLEEAGGGFQVTWKQTLHEAFAALRAGAFGVVMLDLKLPDSEFEETLPKLRHQWPDVPVVVYTGTPNNAYAMRAMQEGAQDFLPKQSLDGAVLRRTLSFAMERQALLRDVQQSREKAERKAEALQTSNRLLDQSLGELRSALSREQDTIRELESVMQVRDEYLAVFSHDLRAPMQTVLGYTELLLSRWDAFDDERKRRSLETVRRNCLHVSRLVDNVLQVATMDAGGLRFERQPYDLSLLIHSLAADLSERAHLTVLAPTGLPRALGDQERTWEVLSNLLSNAMKFSPETGDITIEVDVLEAALHVSVRDQGPGLDKSQQALLFRKFSRVEGPASTTRGAGLGLYICKRMIEAQGGRIWVESQPLHGSTFHFLVPRADAAPNQVSTERPLSGHA